MERAVKKSQRVMTNYTAEEYSLNKEALKGILGFGSK